MLITFGCKKSDKNGPIVDTSPTGVAQNKKTLDAQSSQLGAEITSMSDTKVATLFKSSPITKLKSGGGVLNSNLPIIKFIKTLSTGKATKESLLKVMKSDTTVNIQAEFDKHKGTYTYTATGDSFVYTKGTDNKIIALFPSDSTKKTVNDVTATITMGLSSTAYTYGASGSSTTLNPPTSCNASIVIGTTTALTYSFTAAYDSKGYPTAVNSELDIEQFSLIYAFARSDSKLTSDLTLKDSKLTSSDKIVFAEGMEFDGTLTSAEASSVDTYYNDPTNTNKQASKVGEFIANTSMYYQFLDTKIIATLDVANFTKAYDALSATDKGDNFTNNDSVTVNKYCKLYAIFVSSNRKIADAVCYPKVSTEQVWNGTGYTTQTYTDMGILLVFTDGSKSDLDAYCSDPSNFVDFRNDLNSVVKK